MPHVPDEVVDVAEAFATLARTLAAHHADPQRTLERIVYLAVEILDACEFAGISLIEKGKVSSPASSNDIPRKVDEIQAEVNEGPCVDAIKESEVFQTGALTDETRWPKFSVRAHEETGICSILAIRLFLAEDTIGALNLYSTARDAFDESDVGMASVFAAHASVAVAAARREHTLEEKAQSRDVIGRAKGILMAQSGVTDDQAFAMLTRASQRMNMKLRDVAQRMAEHVPASHPPR